MDNRSEVREFLMSRRAKLSPAQVGLTHSGDRRVPGLRRSEVAALADVSIEYYARIERGRIAGVSDSVLNAVAAALRLDDAEREHLFDLARVANKSAAEPVRRRKPRTWAARESLTRALDAITNGPAFLRARNGRMDVLATNLLGRAFYDQVFDGPGRGNLARFCSSTSVPGSSTPDWEAASDVTVAILHTEAGRDPRDKQLHDLIGELSTRSGPFRTRWGAHDVRRARQRHQNFHHHLVGDLTLTYEGMELTAEPGLSFLIYTAEPGSPSRAPAGPAGELGGAGQAPAGVRWSDEHRHNEGEHPMNVVPKASTAKHRPDRFTGDVSVNGSAAPQDADQRMVLEHVADQDDRAAARA